RRRAGGWRGTGPLPRQPRRPGRPPRWWGLGSGAVATEHTLLVGQLAPDRLDEVAVLAHELRVLLGLDPDRERLDPVVPAHRKDRLLVLLFLRSGAVLRLLRQDLVEAGLGWFLVGLDVDRGVLVVVVVFALRCEVFFVFQGVPHLAFLPSPAGTTGDSTPEVRGRIPTA